MRITIRTAQTEWTMDSASIAIEERATGLRVRTDPQNELMGLEYTALAVTIEEGEVEADRATFDDPNQLRLFGMS